MRQNRPPRRKRRFHVSGSPPGRFRTSKFGQATQRGAGAPDSALGVDGGWTAGGRRRPWVGGGRVSSAESRVDNDRDTVYHDKDYFREGRGRRRGKKGVGGWCCHLTGNRVTVIIPTAIIGRVLGRRAIFFCSSASVSIYSFGAFLFCLGIFWFVFVFRNHNGNVAQHGGRNVIYDLI